MAVQFILGRSGTGKTTCCINAVVNALQDEADQRQLILLVPEQATYQAERAILSDKKIRGYNRLNVVSFNRLSFLLLGRNQATPEISRTARQMIIRKILREQKNSLKILGSSALRPGLGNQIADAVAELQQYDKTPDDVAELAEQLKKGENHSLATMKFADVGLIYKEYLKFIEGKFIDADLQMGRAREAVAKAAFIKGASLWVDGFSSFTSIEIGILSELLTSTEHTSIALCLDPAKIDINSSSVDKLDGLSLFGTTERTYCELLEIISKRKLKLEPPVIRDKQLRFSSGNDICHLERNIFDSYAKKNAARGDIRIFSAPDMRSEIQFIAREILALVREKKLRYRDIAVAAADLESYEYYIRPYFEDFGIPFFIDRPQALNQHPVVQFVCSALRAITEGFAHSDIFSMLKTNLASGCENEDIDLLENYCIAFGINGSDWQSEKDWRFADKKQAQFDETRINNLRRFITGPLIKLRDSIRPADNTEKQLSPEEFTRAVFSLLDDFAIADTLAKWTAEADAAGDIETAEAHQQFYDKFVDIFDELADVFAGCTISCRDYLSIIDSAFSQMKLAFIPPRLDQVLVGSIDRSRHPDLKAVFLPGATQKLFPCPVDTKSLLTDSDRLAAESLRFKMAGGTSRELTDRQYLAYIAFTRPSQMLTITYPLANDKQAPNTRSMFLENIESLFEDLEERSINSAAVHPKTINTESELCDTLCCGLGKDAPENTQLELLNQIVVQIRGEERFKRVLEDIDHAVNYNNQAKLDKETAAALFGGTLKTSISRLSTFAKCPYQYFAKYTLGLKERERFELKPLDIGSFYHHVLDALLKRLNAENRRFAKIDGEELVRILDAEISRLLENDRFISNFIARSRHNEFIIHSAAETLEECAGAIAEMTRAGDFNPVYSELTFGHKEDICGECVIALPGGSSVMLRGIMDRVDIAECDDKKVALIFDYKSHEKGHDFCMLYYGLDMQLAGYMFALRNCAGNKITRSVAGAFYMPVESPPKNVALNELDETNDSFGHKAKGIFNGEYAQMLDKSNPRKWNRFYNFYVSDKDGPYGNYRISGALKPDDFEKLLKFTERKIAELAEGIFKGIIDISPYRLKSDSPCTYCEFRALCRFDWLVNDAVFLDAMDKQEVLEMMGRKK